MSSQILTCLSLSCLRKGVERKGLPSISPPFLLLPVLKLSNSTKYDEEKILSYSSSAISMLLLLLPSTSSTAADWTSQQITVDGVFSTDHTSNMNPSIYNSADGNGVVVVVLFPSIKINMSPNRDWHNIM